MMGRQYHLGHGTWRPPPKVEREVLRRIDALHRAYAASFRQPRLGAQRAKQLALPITREAEHLPRGFLPISPFELLQRHIALGAIYPMPRMRLTDAGELVIACSRYETDQRRRLRPIIYVHPEHLDESDEPTSLGRFAAHRELARLISSSCHPARGISGTSEECTVYVPPGRYLERPFFEDPLNRWAMELACPVDELRVVLQKEWADLPVTPDMLEKMRPLFADEDFALERAFFERAYCGLRIDQLFGLDRHAVMAWCRHRGLVSF